MTTRRTVAISGIGSVCGFGSGTPKMWNAVLFGKCCVAESSHIGSCLDVKCSVAQMAYDSAHEAFVSSGIGSLADVPFILGTNVGRVRYLSDCGREDLLSFLSESTLPKWADHGVLARDIAIALGCDAKGTLALTGACASGMLALGYAFDLIASGKCRWTLAGGADEQTAFKSSGHQALGSASPSGVIRPFDTRRDGTAFCEGAGFMMLEDLESCLQRGHQPLGILAGYGVGTDTTSLTAPDPEGRGAIIAMRTAITDAGLTPAQIDHVQAHATGTRLNDAIEARAIARVFGSHPDSLTLSADKGSIGHTYGASGALSTILAVLMIQKGCVPPIIGCLEPDSPCVLPLVLKHPFQKTISAALCNNFGFGGCNAAMVIRRFESDL